MVDVLIRQAEDVVISAATMSPLPPVLHRGLLAVAFFGLLSLIASTALFLCLGYRLLTWKRKTHTRVNQFVVLIFNLVFADILQSVAFVLNAQWLLKNSIVVDTHVCWAQAWFISTGDLASGVFTFAIAVHSFNDIVCDYRLGHTRFMLSILLLWTFVYACAIIGVATHPSDFYQRAGAWCWINTKYINERFWLHYFWVMICEFGTVIIYILIFLILSKRVRDSFYTTPDTQVRAQSAAKLILAYPIIYVVCTLPLVIARLKTMAGGHVTFIELCVAGVMITSNGWLDVLLYSLTRRCLIFGPEVTHDITRALDTFNWLPNDTYGNTTTIEANHSSKFTRRPHLPPMGGTAHTIGTGTRHSHNESTENLFRQQRLGSVITETVVQVQTEPIEMNAIGRGDVTPHKPSDSDLTAKSQSSLETSLRIEKEAVRQG